METPTLIIVKAINNRGEVLAFKNFVCKDQDFFLVEDFVKNQPEGTVRVLVDIALPDPACNTAN